MKLKLSLNKWFLAYSLIIAPFTTAFAENANEKYKFPELPYAYNALEPAIDAKTMELHYNMHHRGYYTKFIKEVDDAQLSSLHLEEIFSRANKLPLALRNNAGGYYNHMLFWNNLTPNPPQDIPSKLKKALEDNFGSIEKFKNEFTKQALSVFGSGWTWLVITKNNKLVITTTANQDNPLMNDIPIQGKPLLVLDVWEHAYYLKYQNKRANYIDAFWSIVNWTEVEKRLLD